MNYMPTAVPIHKQWDLAFVGAKLEAFAIAGCDIVSKCILFFPSKIGARWCDLRFESNIKAESWWHEASDQGKNRQHAWYVSILCALFLVTSSYHCILYTQGKCLHRHLFPARTFKDMKYCGNFINIDFYYLPYSISLLPRTMFYLCYYFPKTMFKSCYCLPELYFIASLKLCYH